MKDSPIPSSPAISNQALAVAALLLAAGIAAAAAYAAMLEGCAPGMTPPRPFVANRPFIFLIREARSGLILFMGRVATPTPPASGTHANNGTAATPPLPPNNA